MKKGRSYYFSREYFNLFQECTALTGHPYPFCRVRLDHFASRNRFLQHFVHRVCILSMYNISNLTSANYSAFYIRVFIDRFLSRSSQSNNLSEMHRWILLSRVWINKRDKLSNGYVLLLITILLLHCNKYTDLGCYIFRVILSSAISCPNSVPRFNFFEHVKSH